MEQAVLENVHLFCYKILDSPDINSQNGWHRAINLTELIGHLMTDIMGDIIFHRNWEMVERNYGKDILGILTEGVTGLNMV